MQQANEAKAAIQAHSPFALTLDIATTTANADRDFTKPVEAFGVGAFVKTIEMALTQGAGDIGVHSLKDLPTSLDPAFTIAAVLKRQDPRDVLIAKSGQSLSQLPKGAIIGTESPRRRAFALHQRPDLQFTSMRGGVITRLHKLDSEPQLEALILAGAGLQRLGLEHRITQWLPVTEFVPAAGQGALALETLATTELPYLVASSAQDTATALECQAERAFIATIEAGCTSPVGVLAQITGESQLTISAAIGTRTGTTVLKEAVTTDLQNPLKSGNLLARKLLDQGAKELMN